MAPSAHDPGHRRASRAALRDGSAACLRAAVPAFMTHVSLEPTRDARETYGRDRPLVDRPTTGEASMRTVLSAGVLALSLAATAHAEVDWKQVEQVFGRPGPEQPGGVHRFSLPRSDLKVTLDGIAIKPALALGSWLAFHPTGGDEAMVMGDLVLTEPELKPVMKVLAGNGIDVTAIHNHLLRAQPATMYLHVEGHGDPLQLARALRLALEQSDTPVAFQPAPTGAQEQGPTLDTAALDRILGRQGKANGGVYQFSIPRAEDRKSVV